MTRQGSAGAGGHAAPSDGGRRRLLSGHEAPSFNRSRGWGHVFPFRSELFDVAEAYLSVTDERTRLSGDAPDAGQQDGHRIAEDNEYKKYL